MPAVHEVGLPALRTVSQGLLRTLPSDGFLTAWVSGSLVEGLGNSGSDVDIFVAHEGRLSDKISLNRNGSDHGVLGRVWNGTRFDIEFWPSASIERLSCKLAQLPVDDPAKNNLHFLEYWESEFIHRLLVGEPLFDESAFDRLKKKFDRSRFARFLQDTAVRRADDAFDDAVGMLRSGDTRSAALRAREAIEFSMDAFIHSREITNDKAKFRLRKLERLIPSAPAIAAYVDRFWELERQIPVAPDRQSDYVKNALHFSSELVDLAQSRRDITHLRTHSEERGGHPQRAYYVRKRRDGNSTFLVHLTDLVSLGPFGEAVWDKLNGMTSVNAIVEELAQRFAEFDAFALLALVAHTISIFDDHGFLEKSNPDEVCPSPLESLRCVTQPDKYESASSAIDHTGFST